jgi:YD repeat-containing protein
MYVGYYGKPFEEGFYLKVDLDDHQRIRAVQACDEWGHLLAWNDPWGSWTGHPVPETWTPVQLGDPDMELDEGI